MGNNLTPVCQNSSNALLCVIRKSRPPMQLWFNYGVFLAMFVAQLTWCYGLYSMHWNITLKLFCIIVTSWWVWWRFKSPTFPLFAQLLVQTQIKENIKAPCHWPFLLVIHRWPVNSPNKRPVTREMFPIWWRHHGTEYKWQGHHTVNTLIPCGTKWMNAPQLTCTNGIHAFLFLNWKDKSGFIVTCNIWCTPTVWNYVWQ